MQLQDRLEGGRDMSEKIILEILFILIAILTYAVLDNRNKNNLN